jgi:hypothetical protein
MNTRRLTDGNIGVQGEGERPDEDDVQSLLSALEELLGRLSGQHPDGLGSGPEEVESWEGGEFLYLETPLPSAEGAEIEVSIQGGRAFIRMAR